MPNPDQTEIYYAALQALRAGAIPGVKLLAPLSVVRWTNNPSSYRVFDEKGMPPEYRSAIAGYRKIRGDAQPLDLSHVDFGDVTIKDNAGLEPGACTIEFTALGMGEDLDTAVTRVRVRCDTSPAIGYDLLICVKDSEWGWTATNFARLSNPTWNRLKALYAPKGR